MGKAPAFQFYVRDWLADPDLQMASSSTRGIWINALCYMWESRDRGRITGEKMAMARMLRCSNGELEHFLEEADQLHFCDVERQENVRGDKILTLTNRRMFREEKSKKLHRERQVRYEERIQSKSNDAKNDGKVTPPSSSSSSSSKKKHYVEGSDELRLSAFLLEEIRKNKPDFKKPNLQDWAREIELVIQRDGRNPDRIRQVIKWCQGDSFWWKNVLSVSKLRKQFDRLEAEMLGSERSEVSYPDLTSYPDLPQGG